MRNPSSLFSTVVNFINAVEIGKTYQSRHLCEATRGIERVTRWKRSNSNPSYRTRTYQTYLSRAGYLKNVSYGVWVVLKHIPADYTLHNLHTEMGYVYTKRK
jgi:hypothetical protein